MKNKIKQFNLSTESDRKAYLELINNPSTDIVTEKSEFTLDGQYLMLLHYTVNQELLGQYVREWSYDYAVLDLSDPTEVALFEHLHDTMDIVRTSYHFVKKQGFFMVAIHFKDRVQTANFKIAKIRGRR